VTCARLGALVLLAVVSLGSASNASAQEDGDRETRGILTIDVPRVSFEQLMSIPEVVALARSGGAGLMANAERMSLPPPVRYAGPGSAGPPGEIDVRIELGKLGLEGVGSEIRELIEAYPTEELLVLVVSSGPSDEMVAAKDDIRGVAMAVGAPDELLASVDPEGSLTSDSTRRDGVVVGEDVLPTIDAFENVAGSCNDQHASSSCAEAADAVGAPIEIIEGPPPFELHERYLAQRRMHVPIGTAAGIYVTLAGLAGVAVLAFRRRVPERLRRFVGWACLSIAMLATSLLAAGHLPDLTYATVVPFVALVAVFGTLAFAPLEDREVLLVPTGIGITVLLFFVLEAALSWTAALTPFVGGSELDGGRFYGLPNAFIGLLIGACLWVAHRLRTSAGVALLVAAALFAGLPYLGSNLGGGVSLFAAAGLWLAVRERGRLGAWRGIGVFVGFTLGGLALLLVAHAVSPFETHVTGFEQQAGGLGGVFEKFGDRLQVGFDLIARNPFALIPVLGLPITIVAVLWPPAPLRPSLERSPAWRDAILVTLLAGVVAYVVNDSGPAAAGFAFGLGLGGLLGVSLLSEAGKMVAVSPSDDPELAGLRP
jgi:hypothetical protein